MFLNFMKTIPKNFLTDKEPYPVWKIDVDADGYYRLFEYIPSKSKYEVICGRITTLDGAESEMARQINIRREAQEFGKNVFYYDKDGNPVYKL